VAKWFSNARRRAAVARGSGTDDPLEVCHALDFFIWAALDDIDFLPKESRPFGDDERHYNAILNAHFRIDVPSSALQTEFRLGGEKTYYARYFPDEYLGTHTVAKDSFVVTRLSHQVGTLRKVAKAGRNLTSPPELPSSETLINPEAYVGYYNHLRDSGARFADATPEQREAVCVWAMKSAVIAPGDVEGEIVEAEGWVAVHHEFARRTIQDFLDPEALLP
jgi:hypothetical protein